MGTLFGRPAAPAPATGFIRPAAPAAPIPPAPAQALTPEQRAAQLKADIDRAMTMKSRLEGTLEEKQAQRAKLIEQLAAAGVTPEELPATIEKLRTEIEQLLSEAEAAIPRDLLQQQGRVA